VSPREDDAGARAVYCWGTTYQGLNSHIHIYTHDIRVSAIREGMRIIVCDILLKNERQAMPNYWDGRTRSSLGRK
jgi:hypothetical protein